MDFWTIILIAVGLAMDCFAVSLGIGTTATARRPRSIFRLVFHFGLFQGLMTILGWLLGSTIVGYISTFDHWIAMALLGYVGGKMIWEGIHPEEEQKTSDPSRGRHLILLSIATSIDALAVGLSIAMLDVNVIYASLVIGAVSLILSLIGLMTGNFLGTKFGKRMEILGGIILIGIGLRVVITHLFM